ncbi:hypothetical protein J2Y40_001036 [Chryseobacterium sp. 2987]|nr:hypothetical protein [Chryseobacterium sp. 2987]
MMTFSKDIMFRIYNNLSVDRKAIEQDIRQLNRKIHLKDSYHFIGSIPFHWKGASYLLSYSK